MHKRTILELSRQAFFHNIRQIKKAAGIPVAVVVKSNAYGHGLQEIGLLGESCPDVAWFCTAGIQEALALRSYGITKPILVLAYLDGDLSKAIAQDIHFTVYNKEDICALNKAAEKIGKKAYVHVKVDTGMSRLGIVPEQVLSFIHYALAFPFIELFGISTHLCDTPNTDPRFSINQFSRFNEVIDMVEAAGITVPCMHAQSSSSLLIDCEKKFSFIRAGAASYGIWKSESHKNRMLNRFPDYNLKQVLQWKTHIIHIKEVPTGATVGYDRTFTAQRPTRLAIAPLGYSDGYNRGLSNKGIALIKNQYVSVAGIVSMNLVAFDITDVEDVNLHDEIILLADMPSLRAHSCAQRAGIITNEFVSHIKSELERTVVEEHSVHQIRPRPHIEQTTSLT